MHTQDQFVVQKTILGTLKTSQQTKKKKENWAVPELN